MRHREQDSPPNPCAQPTRTAIGLLHPGLELPPGASFDPDPQTDLNAASLRAEAEQAKSHKAG
ncbi:hypothetical protein D3C78_1355020 [compost metagenome]